MNRTKILSGKYNMSLGFLPIVLFFLLCKFITHDIAIYISTIVGVLSSAFSLLHKGKRLPQFILYCTTITLLSLSVLHLAIGCDTPSIFHALVVEINVLILPVLFYFNRKNLLIHYKNKETPKGKMLYYQGIEATIVSVRIMLILALIQFIVSTGILLFDQPLGKVGKTILLQIFPPLFFLLTILFNQVGIYFFNKIMQQTAFFPIVNKQGDVVGKCMASDALTHKTAYINPVIRIAIASHGMLLLRPRPHNYMPEYGMNDIAIEDYLLFGESLEEGVKRILEKHLHGVPTTSIRFNFVYHYENKVSNRLAYLFTLMLDDEKQLGNNIKGGKLWTFRQISHNLHKQFFSSFFEYEYEELKQIIYTREKYKES